jgi:hypothetical protein
MPHLTKEHSSGVGQLVARDGRSASVRYRLRLEARVEDRPGFGRFEHIPKLLLSFPDGTGGIEGPSTFTTSDGRSVTCDVDGREVVITGSLR